MPVFSYRSTTMEGVVAEGVIEAADEKAAIARLKETGVIPLEVRAPASFSRLGSKIGFRRRRRSEERRGGEEC